MIGTQCINCVFFGDECKCAAFPNGIPEEILVGKIDHSKPYDGDHGIVFIRAGGN